jgi:hypothetical protein
MRTKLAMLTVLAVLLAFTAVAGEEAKPVTLHGKIACAMCVLKVDGAKECQSVLVVESEGKEPMHYYLVKNEAAKEYAHTCGGAKEAVVTGMVAEKDGKMWITATKVEKPA